MDAADDWDAGMSPAYLRKLITYWRDQFDWRSQEALLNRFKHYRGEVDGTRIHLIHEGDRALHPLPLILTHGYPDSFFRFYKLIPLLTDPATMVVIPSTLSMSWSQAYPDTCSPSRARDAEACSALATCGKN